MNTHFHKLVYAVLIALVTATGVFGTRDVVDVTSARASAYLDAGTIWYVATTGDDSNDCATTTTPCATINGAIGKAAAGDVTYVASGIYTGSGTEVVLIDKAITLSGGWDAGFSIQSGMSTIDGESARRGIRIYSGNAVSIESFIIQNGFHSSQGGALKLQVI